MSDASEGRLEAAIRRDRVSARGYGRRTVLLAAAAGVLAAGGSSGSVHARNSVGGTPADVHVFHIPHQDDEVLTFGAPLLEAINSSAEVHCVLLTHGAASVMRPQLVRQGWLADDPEVFVAARNREFYAALDALGVPRSNVHLRSAPDGGSTLLTYEVEWAVRRWPHAIHHGMSWRDPHPDHQGSGLALNAQRLRHPNLRVRFWQYPLHRKRYPINATELPVPEKVRVAAAEYAVWDPTPHPPERSVSKIPNLDGRYAIGSRSVPAAFEGLRTNPDNWFRWHGPHQNPEPASLTSPDHWDSLYHSA